MRASLAFLVVASISLSGCFQQTPPTSSDTPRDGKMITAFGEHHAMGEAFIVKVSALDGKLEVVRGRHFDALTATNPMTGQVSTAHNASFTNSWSPDGWKAQTNWFVLVEDPSRLWAYDGDKYLYLLIITTAAGDSVSYGPRTFPCPVPASVRSRLSAAAQAQITP